MFTDSNFNEILEQLPDVVYRYLVQERRFEFINQAVAGLSGYTPQEFYIDPDLILRIIHPEDLSLLRVMLSERGDGFFVLRWVRRDGEIVWVEHNQVVLIGKDKPNAYLGTVRRVNLDKNVRPIAQTEDALLRFIQSEPAAVAIGATGDGRLVECNPNFARTLGFSPAELRDKNLIDLDLWQEPEDHRMLILAHQAGAKICGQNYRLRSRGDRQFVLHYGSIPFQFAGEECVLVNLSESSPEEQVRYFIQKLAMVNEIGRSLSESRSMPEIYDRLAHFVTGLMPDVTVLFVSRYHPQPQQITCEYALLNGEKLDVSHFPPLDLEPPGKGTQSEAIHRREPVIIGDLPARLRGVSKVVYMGNKSEDMSSQSSLCVPMLSREQVLGVIQLQSQTPARFSPADAKMLSAVANIAAVALQNAGLIQSLQDANQSLAQSYDDTLDTLMRFLELRDDETEGHTMRVTNLVVKLGDYLKLSADDLVNLRRGAILHDLGKAGIPDKILHKPGPLDDDEWKIMRMHPVYAYQMLSGIPYLNPCLDVPYRHHERWDGSGYPGGLKGLEIPFHARIFAIIDVWDALLSRRPYRDAWPLDKVKAYIREQSGKQFDPCLVDAFMAMVDSELAVQILAESACA